MIPIRRSSCSHVTSPSALRRRPPSRRLRHPTGPTTVRARRQRHGAGVRSPEPRCRRSGGRSRLANEDRPILAVALVVGPGRDAVEALAARTLLRPEADRAEERDRDRIVGPGDGARWSGRRRPRPRPRRRRRGAARCPVARWFGSTATRWTTASSGRSGLRYPSRKPSGAPCRVLGQPRRAAEVAEPRPADERAGRAARRTTGRPRPTIRGWSSSVGRRSAGAAAAVRRRVASQRDAAAASPRPGEELEQRRAASPGPRRGRRSGRARRPRSARTARSRAGRATTAASGDDRGPAPAARRACRSASRRSPRRRSGRP